VPQRFSPTCSRRSVWPSLRRYPTAAAAARLGEKHLAAFLTQHGYSGRRAASVLLARLRSAPSGITDPALTGAVHDWCSLWFTVLQAGGQRRRQEPGPVCHHSPRGAPGQQDLHVGAEVWSDQRRPGCSPSGAIPVQPTTDPTPSPPSPEPPQSPKPPADNTPCASARPATSAFARPSRPSPTTPATKSPWAAHVYTQARSRGHDHPTRSASRPARGSA